MLDNGKIAESCILVGHRCTSICGTMHGSAWLFDKVMRFFDAEPAATAVTIPVTLNCIGPGTATIGRDGSLAMQRSIK